MKAKITLGKTPETFKPATVSFKLPDGSEGAVEVTFKYRTREQYGEFVDQTAQTVQGALNGGTTVASTITAGLHSDAEMLVGCVAAWDLGEPVTLHVARQLSNEYPAVVNAILGSYRRVMAEGHLGN